MLSFTSLAFWILFLPPVLLINAVVPHRARHYWLLAVSIFFYATFSVAHLIVLLLAALVTWGCGKGIEIFTPATNLTKKMQNSCTTIRKVLFIFTVCCWVFELAFTKYASQIDDQFGFAEQGFSLDSGIFYYLYLIGISFITFSAISYITDVYRNDTTHENSLPHLMLYLLFFPKVISGPIVLYKDFSYSPPPFRYYCYRAAAY